MYARITSDLKESLESRVRSIRIASTLKLYPISVVVFSAGAVLLLFTKAHGLVGLIIEALDSRYTEPEVMTGMVGLVILAVSVGLIYLLRSMIQEPVFEEHHFCGPCNAVDKDDEAICPFCNQALKTKEIFFFTQYADEIRLADSFGLTPANEA